MFDQLLSKLLIGILALPVVARLTPWLTPTAVAGTEQTASAPTRANLLRGSYGLYRANNDLLFYHLDLRVDPDKKYISGTNTIRFKMLEDGSRIQLELYPTLAIDKILMGSTTLKYERDGGNFFVDFPKTLSTGRTYSIDVHYSGSPTETGRFGCFTFKQDSAGHPWINTACEGDGAYV